MENYNNPIKFELSDGFIEVLNNTLFIHDRAKKDRLVFLFMCIIFFLFGSVSIYKWTQNEDNVQLAFGLISIILNLILLWKWIKEFKYIGNEILLTDISYLKQVNLKLDDTKVGLISIKGKKYRRIKMHHNDLKEFSDFLRTTNIKIKA